MDAILSVAAMLFGGAWQLLAGIDIPGTEISFAVLLCAVALVGLSLRLIRLLIGGNKDNV